MYVGSVLSVNDIFNGVVAKGFDAEYRLGLEKALNPLRFTRIPGVTADLAQEVFRVLNDGVIDANGLRRLVAKRSVGANGRLAGAFL